MPGSNRPYEHVSAWFLNECDTSVSLIATAGSRSGPET